MRTGYIRVVLDKDLVFKDSKDQVLVAIRQIRGVANAEFYEGDLQPTRNERERIALLLEEFVALLRSDEPVSEETQELNLGQWDDHPGAYGQDDHGLCPSCKKPYLRKKQNEHTDTFYHERGSCDLIKPGHVDSFLVYLKARALGIDMSRPFIVPEKKPGAMP